jgi:hypothetical protein
MEFINVSNTASWITFGKDRYHQHPEMEQWCKDNIGKGKWICGTPKTWKGLEDIDWAIDSMFGNTTFAFKDAKHLTLFILRWA